LACSSSRQSWQGSPLQPRHGVSTSQAATAFPSAREVIWTAFRAQPRAEHSSSAANTSCGASEAAPAAANCCTERARSGRRRAALLPRDAISRRRLCEGGSAGAARRFEQT